MLHDAGPLERDVLLVHATNHLIDRGRVQHVLGLLPGPSRSFTNQGRSKVSAARPARDASSNGMPKAAPITSRRRRTWLIDMLPQASPSHRRKSDRAGSQPIYLFD